MPKEGPWGDVPVDSDYDFKADGEEEDRASDDLFALARALYRILLRLRKRRRGTRMLRRNLLYAASAPRLADSPPRPSRAIRIQAVRFQGASGMGAGLNSSSVTPVPCQQHNQQQEEQEGHQEREGQQGLGVRHRVPRWVPSPELVQPWHYVAVLLCYKVEGCEGHFLPIFGQFWQLAVPSDPVDRGSGSALGTGTGSLPCALSAAADDAGLAQSSAAPPPTAAAAAVVGIDPHVVAEAEAVAVTAGWRPWPVDHRPSPAVTPAAAAAVARAEAGAAARGAPGDHVPVAGNGAPNGAGAGFSGCGLGTGQRDGGGGNGQRSRLDGDSRHRGGSCSFDAMYCDEPEICLMVLYSEEPSEHLVRFAKPLSSKGQLTGMGGVGVTVEGFRDNSQVYAAVLPPAAPAAEAGAATRLGPLAATQGAAGEVPVGPPPEVGHAGQGLLWQTLLGAVQALPSSVSPPVEVGGPEVARLHQGGQDPQLQHQQQQQQRHALRLTLQSCRLASTVFPLEAGEGADDEGSGQVSEVDAIRLVPCADSSSAGTGDNGGEAGSSGAGGSGGGQGGSGGGETGRGPSRGKVVLDLELEGWVLSELLQQQQQQLQGAGAEVGATATALAPATLLGAGPRAGAAAGDSLAEVAAEQELRPQGHDGEGVRCCPRGTPCGGSWWRRPHQRSRQQLRRQALLRNPCEHLDDDVPENVRQQLPITWVCHDEISSVEGENVVLPRGCFFEEAPGETFGRGSGDGGGAGSLAADSGGGDPGPSTSCRQGGSRSGGGSGASQGGSGAAAASGPSDAVAGARNGPDAAGPSYSGGGGSRGDGSGGQGDGGVVLGPVVVERAFTGLHCAICGPPSRRNAPYLNLACLMAHIRACHEKLSAVLSYNGNNGAAASTSSAPPAGDASLATVHLFPSPVYWWPLVEAITRMSAEDFKRQESAPSPYREHVLGYAKASGVGGDGRGGGGGGSTQTRSAQYIRGADSNWVIYRGRMYDVGAYVADEVEPGAGGSGGVDGGRLGAMEAAAVQPEAETVPPTALETTAAAAEGLTAPEVQATAAAAVGPAAEDVQTGTHVPGGRAEAAETGAAQRAPQAGMPTAVPVVDTPSGAADAATAADNAVEQHEAAPAATAAVPAGAAAIMPGVRPLAADQGNTATAAVAAQHRPSPAAGMAAEVAPSSSALQVTRNSPPAQDPEHAAPPGEAGGEASPSAAGPSAPRHPRLDPHPGDTGNPAGPGPSHAAHAPGPATAAGGNHNNKPDVDVIDLADSPEPELEPDTQPLAAAGPQQPQPQHAAAVGRGGGDPRVRTAGAGGAGPGLSGMAGSGSGAGPSRLPQVSPRQQPAEPWGRHPGGGRGASTTAPHGAPSPGKLLYREDEAGAMEVNDLEDSAGDSGGCGGGGDGRAGIGWEDYDLGGSGAGIGWEDYDLDGSGADEEVPSALRRGTAARAGGGPAAARAGGGPAAARAGGGPAAARAGGGPAGQPLLDEPIVISDDEEEAGGAGAAAGGLAAPAAATGVHSGGPAVTAGGGNGVTTAATRGAAGATAPFLAAAAGGAVPRAAAAGNAGTGAAGAAGTPGGGAVTGGPALRPGGAWREPPAGPIEEEEEEQESDVPGGAAGRKRRREGSGEAAGSGDGDVARGMPRQRGSVAAGAGSVTADGATGGDGHLAATAAGLAAAAATIGPQASGPDAAYPVNGTGQQNEATTATATAMAAPCAAPPVTGAGATVPVTRADAAGPSTSGAAAALVPRATGVAGAAGAACTNNELLPYIATDPAVPLPNPFSRKRRLRLELPDIAPLEKYSAAGTATAVIHIQNRPPRKTPRPCRLVRGVTEELRKEVGELLAAFAAEEAGAEIADTGAAARAATDTANDAMDFTELAAAAAVAAAAASGGATAKAGGVTRGDEADDDGGPMRRLSEEVGAWHSGDGGWSDDDDARLEGAAGLAGAADGMDRADAGAGGSGDTATAAAAAAGTRASARGRHSFAARSGRGPEPSGAGRRLRHPTGPAAAAAAATATAAAAAAGPSQPGAPPRPSYQGAPPAGPGPAFVPFPPPVVPAAGQGSGRGRGRGRGGLGAAGRGGGAAGRGGGAGASGAGTGAGDPSGSRRPPEFLENSLRHVPPGLCTDFSKPRVFVHSRSMMPYTREELQRLFHPRSGDAPLPDSEDETDDEEEWERNERNRLAGRVGPDNVSVQLPASRQTPPEELEFMLLWNRFARRRALYSDGIIPQRCMEFVEGPEGAAIASSPDFFKLRDAFLTHLMGLNDFALVDPKCSLGVLRRLDARYREARQGQEQQQGAGQQRQPAQRTT